MSDDTENALRHSEDVSFANEWGPIPRDMLETLQRKHGEIWALKNVKTFGSIIFRRASKREAKEFKDKVNADNYMQACAELVSQIVVYPDLMAYQAMAERYDLDELIAGDMNRIRADKEIAHSKKYETPQT